MSARSLRRPAALVAAVVSVTALLAGCASASGAGSASQPAAASSGAGSTSAGPDAPTPSPTPTPTPYDGPVFAVGDSVMLGAAPCMEARGIRTDAAESRSFIAGVDLLQGRLDRDKLPDRVVIHLGTNGPIASGDFEALMDSVGDRDVYWVNVHLPDLDNYYYADEVNALLDAEAEDYPNLHVIDWDATAQDHPGWLYSDATHLTPKGCEGFARMVDTAVREPLPDQS